MKSRLQDVVGEVEGRSCRVGLGEPLLPLQQLSFSRSELQGPDSREIFRFLSLPEQ